jgi:DNA-binding MarR family transcriptional regulator
MTINEYLAAHSINEDFVKKIFRWSWDATTITIPIFDPNAKHLTNRYRHLDGSPKFSADKGSHPTLYASHLIKTKNTIVLCEGEPDCVRLWQEGIPAVTGTSGVKTFNPSLAEPLKGKKVLITLDTDKEGQSSIEKYYTTLLSTKATPLIKNLPPQYKDICDYFTAGYTKSDFDKLPELTLDDYLTQNEPEEYAFEEGSSLLKRDIPPEEWLVDRILPAEGFAFIIGPEATGKSFYTLTLAHSITTLTPWLNKFSANKTEKVLIIDKENTKRRTQSRMRGLSMNGKNIFWLKYPHYFQLSDDSSQDGFSEIAKAASRKVKKEGIKVIMIDSFTDVMVGNENAAGDVQKFFDACRQLFPGTSILVLHHASKPTPGLTRTSAQRARGSTNIMAQIYSGFFVEALPNSKKEFTIEQTKAGDAEKLNKFLVELEVKPVPGSGGEKTYVTNILYKGEIETEEMKLAEAISVIEEAFKATSSISRQKIIDICQGTGISQRTAIRALKQMTDDEIIESAIDQNNKSRRLYVYRGQQAEIYREND